MIQHLRGVGAVVLHRLLGALDWITGAAKRDAGARARLAARERGLDTWGRD